MTEFIENPDEKVHKQDCELKAFYRLTRSLKAPFQRLPVLTTGDGLYAWVRAWGLAWFARQV